MSDEIEEVDIALKTGVFNYFNQIINKNYNVESSKMFI